MVFLIFFGKISSLYNYAAHHHKFARTNKAIETNTKKFIDKTGNIWYNKTATYFNIFLSDVCIGKNAGFINFIV